MTEFSVGVEEEYQLIDRETGALCNRATEVLGSDWSDDMVPEVQQTMVEVGTPVCGTAAEAGHALRRLRLQTAVAAAAHDALIVAAGLHPFSRWEDQQLTPGARYQRLVQRFGRVLRTEHVFGMHVHVGIPAEQDRIELLNRVRLYLPHLISLSANSPLYEGQDTGYASYRSVLTGRLPHSGVPPRLANETDFRALQECLTRGELLEDAASLYWSIRPHPRYPTLEFRAADVCLRVEDAVAIAALLRALVRSAAEGVLPAQQHGTLSAAAADAVLQGNVWQAARYGMDAVFADPSTPTGKVSVRDSVESLLPRICSAADALRDGRELGGIELICRRGNGADRTRAQRPHCDGLAELTLWLAGETVLGTGLDRRTEQRNACE